MTVSVAVMAHPRRDALVAKLAFALGDGTTVVWDRHDDEWDTGRRAWETHAPTADWHLVVQDDAIVCRDLAAGVAGALAHVPAEAVVSLYVGTLRPDAYRVAKAAAQANRTAASWITMREIKWGVALAVPTSVIPDMLEYAEALEGRVYDRKLAQYFRWIGWPVWCTWPSLVDHRCDVDGIVRHKIPPSGPRRAHRFLGESTSALGVNWSSGVVEMPGSPYRSTI